MPFYKISYSLIYEYICKYLIDILFPIPKSIEDIIKNHGNSLPRITLTKIDDKNSHIALYSYKDRDVQLLIKAIKNYRDTRCANIAVEPLIKIIETLIKEILNTKGVNIKCICFIPIPINLIKLNTRGYNQSELLINVLSKKITILHEKKLLKKRNASFYFLRPKDQKLKNRKDRVKDVRNSFYIDKATLKKYNAETLSSIPTLFIIIDDVITTGSTLDEAKKTLLSSLIIDKDFIKTVAIAH